VQICQHDFEHSGLEEEFAYHKRKVLDMVKLVSQETTNIDETTNQAPSLSGTTTNIVSVPVLGRVILLI